LLSLVQERTERLVVAMLQQSATPHTSERSVGSWKDTILEDPLSVTEQRFSVCLSMIKSGLRIVWFVVREHFFKLTSKTGLHLDLNFPPRQETETCCGLQATLWALTDI
jgi:hypothetical protein